MSNSFKMETVIPGVFNIGNNFFNPVVKTNNKPNNLVSSILTGGLGNRIFMIFAGLGYAEKYNKKFVLCKNIYREGTQDHDNNLDDMILRFFPNLEYVDSIEPYTLISEKNGAFTYEELERTDGNVVLTGYFQSEKYFPTQIPSIRNDYYPNTYFIHIRAGDYLFNKHHFIDTTKYHKRCFDRIGENAKYIVFSNDNDYAKNYMDQFKIDYKISDKKNAYEAIVEMSNCSGGICANSSFSWLGAFFQRKPRMNIFMPYIWFDGKHYEDIYSPWSTVVSIDDEEYIPKNRDLFKGKNVLLVLACDRPFYRDRMLNNTNTFNFFKNQGFVVVRLYALEDIKKSVLEYNSNKDYNLYVPCSDSYAFITVKMNHAYNYFREEGCNGILKIDDNTKVIDEKLVITEILPLLKDNDYLGIATGKYKNNGYIYDKRFTKEAFDILRYNAGNEEIEYYGGPFYWVSNNSIEEICKKGLEFIHEDVSVGYVIMKSNNLIKYSNDIWYLFKRAVTWDENTE